MKKEKQRIKDVATRIVEEYILHEKERTEKQKRESEVQTKK